MNNDPTITEILRKENAELKEQLKGANLILDKIAELVGDRGQYRDLVEAVEMKLHDEYERGQVSHLMGFRPPVRHH